MVDMKRVHCYLYKCAYEKIEGKIEEYPIVFISFAFVSTLWQMVGQLITLIA